MNETIAARLLAAKESFGAQPFVISRHQNLSITYGEFSRLTDSAAAGLLARGIVKGDRVGIWSPNNVEWIITQVRCFLAAS